MGLSNNETCTGKPMRLLLALALFGAALVILFFNYGLLLQTFRGPREISEQDLQAVPSLGPTENYVSFKPSKSAISTGIKWGVKDNAGTAFVLLPVGNQFLLCSVRVGENASAYKGRLQKLSGDPEAEVVRRINASNQQLGARLMPISLQSARRIWFDASLCAFFLLGSGLTGLWLLFSSARANRRSVES